MERPPARTYLLGLVLAITGCSTPSSSPPQTPPLTSTPSVTWTPTSSPSPNAAQAGNGCADDRAGGRLISIPAGKSKLAGIVYGTGKTGIVFAHQSDGSACDWMPYAKTVAAKGFQALAFDFGGYGASPVNDGDIVRDVAAAAAYLRATGVTRLILVGGSMGGTAVLVAASRITPRVNGVVSLSSPSSFGGVDALDVMPRLTMPLLLICGKDDKQFVGDVQAEYQAATRSSQRSLVLSDSYLHGHQLVSNGEYSDAKAVAALTAFLARYR